MNRYIILLIGLLSTTGVFSESVLMPAVHSNPVANILASDTSASYAVVAGGSKGIGYAIAEALAKRKYNLILIARHADSLYAAKNKLESLYHIHVDVLVNDLAREEAAIEIAKWCTDNNIRLKVLCNVAGFGGVRDYLSLPLDTLRYMVRLNVESAIALSLTLLPLLEKNAPSYIKCCQHGGFCTYSCKEHVFCYKICCHFFQLLFAVSIARKKYQCELP